MQQELTHPVKGVHTSIRKKAVYASVARYNSGKGSMKRRPISSVVTRRFRDRRTAVDC